MSPKARAEYEEMPEPDNTNQKHDTSHELDKELALMGSRSTSRGSFAFPPSVGVDGVRVSTSVAVVGG